MVLAHHFIPSSFATKSSSTTRRLHWAALQLLCCLWLFLGLCIEANAQTVVGGQTFTEGLAIVNSPSLGSSLQVGSKFELSVDISGDGRLSANDANTRFTFLEAYLISSSTATNLTVARGSDLLGESGSVSHVDMVIPSCAAPGSYQLTIYEGSVINGSSYFSITPIPMRITQPRPGGKPCTTLFNNIEKLPQASSPPPTQPWLSSANPPPDSTISGSESSTSTETFSDIETLTLGTSTGTTTMEATTSSEVVATESAGSTIILSSSDPQATSPNPASSSVAVTTGTGDHTVTVSGSVSTVTQVISSVETQTLTTTRPGTTEIQTTTVSTVSTAISVVTASSTGKDGFFPVNNNRAMGLAPTGLTVTLMILLVQTLL